MGGKIEVAVTVSLISKHIFGNANEDHLKKDFINSKATVLKIAQKCTIQWEKTITTSSFPGSRSHTGTS